jgi:hypothetical protein
VARRRARAPAHGYPALAQAANDGAEDAVGRGVVPTAGADYARVAGPPHSFDGTFDRLDRMRRRRNDAEYPDVDTPDVTADAAAGLIGSGRLGVFGP